MNILAWTKVKRNSQPSKQSHLWALYLNPRNQKIKLVACSHCGVLKGAAPEGASCASVARRPSNMFAEKGWVEDRLVS